MRTEERPARREISILVTDIAAFTPFADTSEPEYVVETLTEYQALVGRIVESEAGRIFDIAGDAIMAVFEDPADVTLAIQRSIRSALAIHLEGRALVGRWKKRGQQLGLSMTMHAGFATVGDLQAGSYVKHVAVGSTVNTAFHLGRVARDGEIIATNRIADAADGLAQVIPRPELDAPRTTRRIQLFELRPL